MAVQAAKGVIGGRASGTETNADIQSGSSSSSIGQREDLANFISMITRDETPFMSSIGKTKATAIYHEWQTDELAPPGNSRMLEGADYVLPTGYTATQYNNGIPSTNGVVTGTGIDGIVAGNPTQADTGTNPDIGPAVAHTGPNRTRLGNYCQINGKTIAISGTRRVIDQAGVADEYAYQLKKRGTELRRDIEFDIVQSKNLAGVGTVTAVSGGVTNSAARTMGTYRAWINDPKTVEYAGTAPAAVTDPGTGRTSYADITTANRGSLSLADIDLVMQKIYQEGGKANKIMLSPKLRRDFSDLMVTDTGVRRNLDEKGKLRQSVDVYMSDFGDVMVMPNYIMGFDSSATANASLKDEAAFIYDSQWFSIATLRPLQEIDVGQRGDSTIGMMVEEFTMEVKNPIGCGAIYGLQ